MIECITFSAGIKLDHLIIDISQLIFEMLIANVCIAVSLGGNILNPRYTTCEEVPATHESRPSSQL